MKARKRKLKVKRRTRRIAAPNLRTADDFFSQPEEVQTEWEDTLRVIAKMRTDGLSLKKAAKQEGVNPRTVSRLAGRALKKRRNGSYAVTKRDSLLRVMRIITAQGPREIEIRSSRDASTIGQYWDAVHKALNGDVSKLAKFQRRSIGDMYGIRYPLVTDLAELKRLGYAGVLSFENIYARTA